MSAQLSHDAVLFHQRILACSGFYTGTLDGSWGPLTDKADADAQAEYAHLQSTLGKFDPRTEAVIATLLPKTQAKAREFMGVASAYRGFVIKLLSGTRTYPEQDALFAQHPKVTNARGGQSNHNFGIAWDIGIFQNGNYLTGATHAEEVAYTNLAKLIKARVEGLEWGGDWKSIIDQPHYQLATGKSLSQVRAAFEAGSAFV